MTAPTRGDPLDPRGEYGFDGSLWGGIGLFGGGLALLVFAGVQARGGHFTGAALTLAAAMMPLLTIFIYIHTTRRGKFRVWAELMRELALSGDERVLDVGCGRGALLTMVGKLLPRGRAVGLDLWSAVNQSGNGPDAARRNLAAEGVAERCALVTGDMRALPFADASFDLVISSLAIHNVLKRDGRAQAIDEIVRVLRPGGRVVVADLAWVRVYANRFEMRGLASVRTRGLGWRFWWGLAVPSTRVVTAEKPA